RWLKGRFLLLKILKRTKKRSRFLKKEILIVFIHLEASFFPDTYIFFLFSTQIKSYLRNQSIHEIHTEKDK
ncbi:hypothetical protein AAA414_03130, partial [Lactobacillus crispatus]|uniref:hypothetical protein n=1 Tax=Lactobacillus crispatus TaxID=47770 RepID=UPI0030FCA755